MAAAEQPEKAGLVPAGLNGSTTSEKAGRAKRNEQKDTERTAINGKNWRPRAPWMFQYRRTGARSDAGAFGSGARDLEIALPVERWRISNLLPRGA